MEKINIYEVFKLSTTRLCREKYNINLTYEQGFINGEVVGLGSSQVLRKIREVCQYKKEDKFICEYIAIHIDKKIHYKTIKNKGIIINGKKFVRFICGAGNARNSTVFMIREDLFQQMFNIMCCGVKPNEISLAKWNAYFALNASSTYEISEPNVCVIPDYKINLNGRFDFIEDNGNINEKDICIDDYCVFDGMGIMSVEYSNKINRDVNLGYNPSAVVLRNTFIKGCVCTMDIKRFCDRDIFNSKEVYSIQDLWGKKHILNNIDIILTESQFKLWKEYKSWDEYVHYSNDFNLGWGVTIMTHEKDDDFTFTNYQFLQVLDLDDKQIKEICQPTINWLKDITGDNIMKLMLYYLGNKKKIDIDKIDKYDIKALLYNHELINDNYIKTRMARSLNKKIRQAYSGKLLIDGNFSFILCDPFALLEYASGLEVKGLLNNNEYFNGYWNSKHVDKIAGMRSPLTWSSEVDILNLKNETQTNEWYKHINNCCTVLNIYGTDTMKLADSDYDGDKFCTTNCKQIIDGVRKEYPYPITYNKKAAPKEDFNVGKLANIDMMSFGSKIGFITNCSTYWWSLLYNYNKDSIEYKELIHRLKKMRQMQGNCIDKRI